MAFFTGLTQYGPSALYAVHQYFGAFGAKPITYPINPWWRPGDLTWVIPSAKLNVEIPLPVHKSGLQPWQGRWVFHERSNLFLACTRGQMTTGAYIDVIKASEIDFTSWSAQPDSLSIEIGNNPGICLAYLLNGAYSGTPQDESGNVKTLPGLLPCIDQIYGGVRAAPTSNVNTIAIKSNGTLKPVNPCDSSIGSGWYNARDNFDGTNAANWIPVFENLADRRAMNNVPAGLANKNDLKLWVAPSKYERNRYLFELAETLVQSGMIGQIEYTPTGGTTPTVLFGNAPNPAFGRLTVEPIPGMRSDMTVLVAPRPKEHPTLSMFLYPHGGQVGEYAVQEDPMALGGDKVPHIAVFPFDKNSALFAGTMDGIPAGAIGLAMIVNEGFAWGSGFLCEFQFDGAAS